MMRLKDAAPQGAARRCVALASLAALCTLVGVSVVLGEDAADEADRTEPVQRMVEDVLANNIFSAERARPERTPEPEPAAEPVAEAEPQAPNPDASLVLVGVVIRDGGGEVFVEDRDAGTVERVRAPGSFGQGEITDVHIDAVRYRVDGTTATISIQQSFAGEEVDRLAEGARGEGSGGGDRRQRDEADDAERETILERLRRARQRERGE